jgi:hypothetical protein
MNKETMKQEANQLFATTAHKVLWANPKGEFFTSENNCNTSLKAGEIATKFEKTEAINDSEKVYELNAKDTVAKIKATTTLEELKDFEEDERKSVKTIYDAHHAKLVAEINVTIDASDKATGTE